MTLSAFQVSNGLAPDGGPKGLPFNLDLTTVLARDFDLTKEQDADQINFVQSAFVDNSLNSTALTISIQGVPFSFKIPAFSQGVFPVISTGHLKATFSTSVLMTAIVPIIFLNVPMAYAVWGISQNQLLINSGGDFAMQNVATSQPLFIPPTSLSILAGTYKFESVFSLDQMSVVVGNGAFDLLGAGTATISDTLYNTIASEGVIGGPQTCSQLMTNTVITATIATPLVNPFLQVIINGCFTASGAGTLIPSFILANAAPAICKRDSYFSLVRVK